MIIVINPFDMEIYNKLHPNEAMDWMFSRVRELRPEDRTCFICDSKNVSDTALFMPYNNKKIAAIYMLCPYHENLDGVDLEKIEEKLTKEMQ